MTKDELLRELDLMLGLQLVTQAEVLNLIGRRAAAVREDEPRGYDAIVARAREKTGDDLEIDRYPLFSDTDDGCWVSAWIWAPYPDEDEEGQP